MLAQIAASEDDGSSPYFERPLGLRQCGTKRDGLQWRGGRVSSKHGGRLHGRCLLSPPWWNILADRGLSFSHASLTCYISRPPRSGHALKPARRNLGSSPPHLPPSIPTSPAPTRRASPAIILPPPSSSLPLERPQVPARTTLHLDHSATMSSNIALNDAEGGVSENVYAVDLPPPPPPLSIAGSGATTRVNSHQDLRDLPPPPPLPLDEKPLADEKPFADEKKIDFTLKPASEKAPAKKPSPAKWKRASRWVRFKLWYNTYR